MALSLPVIVLLLFTLCIQSHGLSPELYSESEVVDIVEDHVSKRSPGERKFNFKVFGEDIAVNLKKSVGFHPEVLPVRYLDVDENGNVVEEDHSFRTTGKDLYGDMKTIASVVIDEVDGNTKIIGNMLGNYAIEPIKEDYGDHTGVLPPMRRQVKHRVYRTNISSHYNFGDDYYTTESDSEQIGSEESIEKRAIPSKIWLNIHAAVDPSHYRHVIQQDQDVATYIRVLYHTAQVAHFSTMANPALETSLHGVTICKTDAACTDLNWAEGKWSYGEYKLGSVNLKRFAYNQRTKIGSDFDLMFFTTRNKISSAPGKSVAAGYSGRPAVCKPFDHNTRFTDRVSLMIDNGAYDGARGIGHEGGHALNMPHDGDDKYPYARACKGGTPQGDYIMGQTKYSPNNWRFSYCSMHYLHEFLGKSGSNCLKSAPSRNEFGGWADWAIGGTYKNLDNQCKAIWGNDHRSCQSASTKNDQICQKLGCTKGSGGYCGLYHLAAIDGSPCGPGYVCMKGYCVRKPW